jgi:tRNA pseudouridine38-40 synthase
MDHFKLIIEYDGTAFHGWQRQAEDRTIQAEIESALGTMTASAVALVGSGRTDAGVHALGQCAHFSCRTAIGPVAFRNGLNSLLPDDIVIRECRRVAPAFHARYDALSKHYRYRLRNHPLPSAIDRRHAWHVRQALDVPSMSAAAARLTGTHDFKAFEGAGSPRSNTERTIFAAELREDTDGLISMDFRGSGFLRYMVRNMVGALVAVGRGKLTPDDITRILKSKNRTLAPATAPAHGLFLVSVDYGDADREYIE